MCRYYIGITIGPIFETISDATNPATLWFASSIFSDLTHRLCRSISVKYKENELKIYSPYYDIREDNGIDDGIGKYHDRIIFSLTEMECSDLTDSLNEVINGEKRKTAVYFAKELQADSDFFEKYLQVKYVILEEKEVGNNCILSLSPYLDELELMQEVHEFDANPFYELFISKKQDNGGKENNEKSANDLIKDSSLMPGNSRLKHRDTEWAKGSIYKIEEIADSITRASDIRKGTEGKRLKYRNYFAVVSADGDGMGKFLKTIDSDTVKEFSHMCLNYASQACEAVFAFGGMAIYAGGDDLLFLAPVLNERGETILDLCREISEKFKKSLEASDSLKGNASLPTLSFGIAIQYIKYPLYEALEKSRQLLQKAKGFEEGCGLPGPYKKNITAVNLMKHSGQSFDILIGNENIEVINEMLTRDFTEQDMAGDADRIERDNKSIQSLLYTVSEFSELIKQLNKCGYDRERYLRAFLNLFDNAGQKNAEEYIKGIIGYYYDSVLNSKGCRIFSSVLKEKATTKIEKDDYWTLVNLLRFRKFLKEKEGDED